MEINITPSSPSKFLAIFRRGYIMFSQRKNLRPIVDPERKRTISLVVRADFIHQAQLNAVVDAVKGIVPGELLENIVRQGNLKL